MLLRSAEDSCLQHSRHDDRLPPTVRLDAAESPAVDAFIEAIGVGGGGAAAADVRFMGGSNFP
jgi:hypothetical protein